MKYRTCPNCGRNNDHGEPCVCKGKTEMFIETRFYDNGSAEAKLWKHRPATDPDDNTGKYDGYVDEIDDLQEWIEDNLEIELDDIVPFVLDLDLGKWVDISPYI